MVKHLGKIILGAIVLGSIGLGSLIARYDTLGTKTETLIKKAVVNSAGEDRIWSTKEKRDFLDKYNLREIIGEGQDIYFRVEGRKADVILGYDLGNNGGFLHGSSASSGTKIGEIHYKELEQLENQD